MTVSLVFPPEINFANSGQNLRKSWSQSVLVLSNSACFSLSKIFCPGLWFLWKAVSIFFKKNLRFKKRESSLERTVSKAMEHSEAAKYLEILFGIFSRRIFQKSKD